jgi:tripartite-type tricarboxylate transporter receptor subunit TctC
MMLARMILAVLLLASAAGGAAAQRADAAAGWPARPVKLIVPFPAGSTDAIGRILAQSLAVRLGEPVVIEKRAEGSGMLGSGAVARARPDGYMLGIATTTSTRALAPRRSPQLGTASVQGFVEQANAKLGKLTFGSAALGGLARLAPKRTSALPNLPTIAESGYSRDEAVLWMPLVAPASSPQPTVAKLNDAIGESLDDADVKTSLTIRGFEVEPDAPEALRDRIAADTGKWPTLVAKAGIQPE